MAYGRGELISWKSACKTRMWDAILFVVWVACVCILGDDGKEEIKLKKSKGEVGGGAESFFSCRSRCGTCKRIYSIKHAQTMNVDIENGTEPQNGKRHAESVGRKIHLYFLSSVHFLSTPK